MADQRPETHGQTETPTGPLLARRYVLHVGFKNPGVQTVLGIFLLPEVSGTSAVHVRE